MDVDEGGGGVVRGSLMCMHVATCKTRIIAVQKSPIKHELRAMSTVLLCLIELYVCISAYCAPKRAISTCIQFEAGSMNGRGMWRLFVLALGV